MRSTRYYIINGITIYRVIAAPFLLLFIILHQPEIFKWFLLFSFFSDAIDGFLARRFKVVSILGSRLDSIGDDLTVAAAIIGMVVLEPEFFHKEVVFLIPLFVLFLLQMVLALKRYGKISSFHTYLAKMAAVMQAVFLCSLFFFKQPVYLLFYAAISLTAIELIEEIILVILIPEWKTDIRGLYWVLKKDYTDSERN